MRYLTRSISGPVLLLIFAFLVFGAASVRADLDHGDPSAVARAFLEAFQARDADTLATLANANNRSFFSELAAAGSTHPRWSNVFSGWRAEAVAAWDGELEPTRYRDGEAIVPFATMASGEVAVVVLTEEDGSWLFEDVNSPDQFDLDALPTTP